MIAADDVWYVRFPDGRVFRAGNTALVRQHIQQRHIRLGCLVRRSDGDQWLPIERVREFADLTNGSAGELPRGRRPSEAPAADTIGVTSRLDLQSLRTAGVRGVLQEMLVALDTSLTRRNLKAAALLTVTCATILTLARLGSALAGEAAASIWSAAVVLMLLAQAAGVMLIANLTCLELSTMRPARWREGWRGLARLTLRLLPAQLAVAAVAVAVPGGLFYLSRWLLTVTRPPWDAIGPGLATAAGVLALLAAAAFVPFLAWSLLFPPILAMEERLAPGPLRQWLTLLRRDFGRAILFEAIAVLFALLLAAPLLLPLAATAAIPLDPRLAPAAACTRTFLACLLVTPAVAFLVVANVFVYLNLRYESGAPR